MISTIRVSLRPEISVVLAWEWLTSVMSMTGTTLGFAPATAIYESLHYAAAPGDAGQHLDYNIIALVRLLWMASCISREGSAAASLSLGDDNPSESHLNIHRDPDPFQGPCRFDYICGVDSSLEFHSKDRDGSRESRL